MKFLQLTAVAALASTLLVCIGKSASAQHAIPNSGGSGGPGNPPAYTLFATASSELHDPIFTGPDASNWTYQIDTSPVNSVTEDDYGNYYFSCSAISQYPYTNAYANYDTDFTFTVTNGSMNAEGNTFQTSAEISGAIFAVYGEASSSVTLGGGGGSYSVTQASSPPSYDMDLGTIPITVPTIASHGTYPIMGNCMGFALGSY